MDDVLFNKAATIERCVARAKEEFEKGRESFATDVTRQDAAILNILRACEACLDMGQYLIRKKKLGLPQSSRDIFQLLLQGGWIDKSLAEQMKRMVGFRNIAVHDYISLHLPIIEAILREHLDEFLTFSRHILQRYYQQNLD